MSETIATKFRAGKFLIKGSIRYDDDQIVIGFGFNRTLLAEIKAFDGSRWNPETKKWSIRNTPRNVFQLRYLTGDDPYKWYDRPLVDFTSNRPLYDHQRDLAVHALTYHYVILAAEPGTGKTLAAIETMEASGFRDWWWVAPKSALRSVQLEFQKWGSKVYPKIITYDSLKKEISNWKEDRKAPHGVVFDESQRIKSPTAQRSQSATELANGIREDWGQDGFVIEMSGTPAPKSPADWWNLCEVACPGFIREGNPNKFRQRLAVIEMKESIQGGVYPQHVTWKDNPLKCDVCGRLDGDIIHDSMASVMGVESDGHAFVKSVNEIETLYQRMKGLVIVKLKKDCLSLPDKIYEVIECKPSASTLRAASLISAKCTTVIQAMTLLRELSDGFQYAEEESGLVKCPLCHGAKEIEAPLIEASIEITEENIDELQDRYPGSVIEVGEYFSPPESLTAYGEDLKHELVVCPKCDGDGEISRLSRTVTMVPCPKEDAAKELFDRFDDVGRTVWYGGFTGSIDRIESIATSQGWESIRVDGRGWQSSWEISGTKMERELEMLRIFQNPDDIHPRIAFIGQASSAGTGLTLTASPVIVYFSNDFNAESRQQSEDRVHRMGMDVNRGATIIDLVHLPTDLMVLTNLKKKKDLQAM